MERPLVAPKGAFFGETSRSITKIMDRDINFAVWNRNCSKFLDWWLQTISWRNVRPIEVLLNLENLPSFEYKLSEEVYRWSKKSADFNGWIVSDIIELARQFMEDTTAKEIKLKISNQRTSPKKFKTCETSLKLICNYGGFQIQWAENDSDEAFYEVQPLDIAVLKGIKWPGNALGGVVFRTKSSDSNDIGLLLEIDYLS